MFYLIGGTPRTGKTSLAKILSKKFNCPWISTDTIESMVSQYVPEIELESLFPKSIIRKETKQSNDIMYKTYSSEEIVDAYLKQSKSLEKALEIFLGCEAKCNHSYIIEGYHVTPSLVSKLKDNFEVQSVFLGREDKEDIFNLAEKIKKSLEKVFNAEGFNYAWNESEIGGQSVPHFHLHVLPRKNGDLGIYKYEPREFLYRPNVDRKLSASEELMEVACLIKENM